MGYNYKHYNTFAYNGDTQDIATSAEFDVTVNEDVITSELFGYEQGNAEVDRVVVGSASID